MLILAIATSIDALAVGVSFAFLGVDIWTSVLVIGLMTGAFSAVGVRLGHVFGARFKSKAEFVGGLILVGIGIKILLEHLL
jgi:putative Mn2+ efflux pump MntP